MYRTVRYRIQSLMRKRRTMPSIHVEVYTQYLEMYVTAQLLARVITK